MVENRQQAQRAIEDGRVLVAGAVADKAARLVSPSEPVVLRGDAPRFVSRGGEKLDAALGGFAIDVAGAVALDAGASTGGFTDCLLQRGVRHVIAVDVGYGQLDARLRADPRVSVHERTNARTLTPEALGPSDAALLPVGVLVADLSFISLRTVVPALVPMLADGGAAVVLVKPQFEAGRVAVARGAGVVRDPGLWAGALEEVGRALERHGTGIMGAMPSPIQGPAGNVEFLLYARQGAPIQGPDRLALLAADAVAAAPAPRVPG